jgi:Type IV secretion-system coupling protein DNA-binding domain
VGTQVDPPHTPVVFPDRHRNQHLVVVGKTGFGKTHALEVIVSQLAARGEGFACFDFHGDASLSLIGRLLQLPRAEERLIVVDPSHPTRSPGINVLASHAAEADRFRKVSEIASILRQRWGVDSFGARTEELLRNSLYTLAGTGRTLADLPKLLTDAALRRRWADAVEHPDIQAYWRDRYEPLSEGMKAAFREPLLNRVTAFLTEPAARHLLGQSESTVDVSRVMRQQQWLIIRLPKGRLREHAHTLGNLLFAQLQFAALAREALPVHERRTFTLVCDEVQNLAENDLGTLITEGRKFGICVITANQFWEQLPKELRGALLSAASHICFRVSSADASILAGELNLEGRSRLTVDLTNLVRGEAVGRFGSQPVVRFRVPGLPAVSPVSAEAFESLIEPITRPREEIERELRQPPPPEPSPTSPTADAPTVKEGQHEW